MSFGIFMTQLDSCKCYYTIIKPLLIARGFRRKLLSFMPNSHGDATFARYFKLQRRTFLPPKSNVRTHQLLGKQIQATALV